MPAVLAAVRAARLAEVFWREPSGGVGAHGDVPLVGDDGPVLALPYALVAQARSLGAADEVLLAVTDPRGSGPAFRPQVLRCLPRLVEDVTGELFSADLLDQELLRRPPSRLLADSTLLRREHWWWLPRLLVHLQVADVHPVAPRAVPAEHLLVVDVDGRLEARVVRVVDPSAPEPVLEPLEDPPGAGPAVLFGQEASPDLERWGRWCWRGRWGAGRLEVRDAPGSVGLPPVPGVLRRWRAHRALERDCRAGLPGAVRP